MFLHVGVIDVIKIFIVEYVILVIDVVKFIQYGVVESSSRESSRTRKLKAKNESLM